MKAQTKTTGLNQIIAQTIGCALAVLVTVPAFGAGRVEIDPNGPFAKRAGIISQLDSVYEGGLADGEKRLVGNAAIISPCRLISNFHVAFGKSTNQETSKISMVKNRAQGHEVNFVYRANGALKTVRAKVRAMGNYIRSDRGMLGDMVVLDLETCLDAKEYAQLDLTMAESSSDVPVGTLMTISAQQALVNGQVDMKIFGQEGCASEAVTPVDGLFVAKCEVQPGMSGSVVYEMGADRRWHWTGLTTQQGADNGVSGRLIAINAKTIATFFANKLGEVPVTMPLADNSAPQSELASITPRTTVR